MSLFGWLAPLQLAWSDTLTRLAALTDPDKRAPRPQVFDLVQVAHLMAEVCRAYNGDGLLDFSEHPARIEWHRQRGLLHRLRLDCDDVAAYGYWLLYGRPWAGRVAMVNVYDGNLATNLSHAVLWVRLPYGSGGRMLDTNLVDPEGGYRGPATTQETPIEYCQRLYGPLGARYDHMAERHWPWEPIA